MPSDPAAGSGAGGEPGPGDVLAGRYEIQGELGRGGMATVYRGRDLRLQRRVAIKVFRDGFSDAVDPRRTTQEMRLLALVDHPSVVSVLDASTGDGTFGAFLVMELVVGDDLGALLHRARGALSADFARRIVADVAGALQALHDRGVVHRDVKPANILVPTGANAPHAQVVAKLTDFGIAQLVDDARITDDAVLGTARYLSPEQVRGAAPQPPSDVYSLGLVLLEALTGRRAFPGPAAEAAVARLQRPPTLPSWASPPLAELLSRMTALDPVGRPAAGAVATALREQLAGRVEAPDAVHTTPTPVVGTPLPAAAAIARTDGDATGPHTTTWTASRGMPIVTGPQPVALEQRTRRRRTPALLAVAASVLAAGVAAAAISAASSTEAPEARRPAAAARPSGAATGPTTQQVEARSSPSAPARTPSGSSVASPAPSTPAPARTTPRPTPSSTAPAPRPTKPVFTLPVLPGDPTPAPAPQPTQPRPSPTPAPTGTPTPTDDPPAAVLGSAATGTGDPTASV